MTKQTISNQILSPDQPKSDKQVILILNILNNKMALSMPQKMHTTMALKSNII